MNMHFVKNYRINGIYFPKQRSLSSLDDRDAVCFLWVRNWIFKCYLHSF